MHIEVYPVLILMLVPATLLILSFNIFVIVVVSSNKELRNATGIMMASLAVADFGMGLSTGLPLVYRIFSTVLMPLACDIMGFLHSISWTVSVFTLALLSLDRYLAIIHPLHYETRMTTQRAGVAIIVIWSFGFLLWSLPLFGVGHFKFNHEEVACYFDLVAFPLQWITYSLVVFLPTSTMIIFTYSAIWKVSWEQRQLVESSMSEEAVAHYRKTIRPALGLVLIIGGFFIAWVPFFIEHLIKAVKGKSENIPEWLEIFIYMLAITSSFWNPIVYVKTNAPFRTASYALLRKFCTCCVKHSVGPCIENPMQPGAPTGSAAIIA